MTIRHHAIELPIQEAIPAWAIEAEAIFRYIERAATRALRDPEIMGHHCSARQGLAALKSLAAKGRAGCPIRTRHKTQPARSAVQSRVFELEKSGTLPIAYLRHDRGE